MKDIAEKTAKEVLEGEKRYAERDPFRLGDHLFRHQLAMTAESLHSKADIACELAYRDKALQELLTAGEGWQPIHLVGDVYECQGLLLAAPELIDADCNPAGFAPGFWQDDLYGEGVGDWVAAGYDMNSDMFVNMSVKPTHFLRLKGPGK